MRGVSEEGRRWGEIGMGEWGVMGYCGQSVCYEGVVDWVDKECEGCL